MQIRRKQVPFLGVNYPILDLYSLVLVLIFFLFRPLGFLLLLNAVHTKVVVLLRVGCWADGRYLLLVFKLGKGLEIFKQKDC